MKLWKMSMLGLMIATVLGSSLLFSREVIAACYDRADPQGVTYVFQPLQGGTYWWVFDGWDADYTPPGFREILVYWNGKWAATYKNRYINAILPAHSGTYDVYIWDLNTCGQVVGGKRINHVGRVVVN